MGLVIKCAVCAAGAGTIAVGGWGINHLMKKEPRAITLEHSTTKPTEGKWWQSYSDKNKLVSNDPSNEAWWYWKYRYTFLPFKKDTSNQSKLDDHFKKIDRGYDSASGTPNLSLNQSCWAAYEKETTDMTNNSNLQDNTKTFCSVG